MSCGIGGVARIVTMYFSLSRLGCLRVSLSSKIILNNFGMISFSSRNTTGTLGESKEEKNHFRRLTSNAFVLLGGVYGGRRFLSSRLTFLYVLSGKDGVALV